MGYWAEKILAIAIGVLFLEHGYAQKISQFAEPTQIQAAARALQENIPGRYEFPRALPDSKMVAISNAAKTRILRRSSLQTFSTIPALVVSARRSLTEMNSLGVAIASLYGGNIHVPPGLNYFSVQNGKISDQNFWLHLEKSDLSPRRVTNVVDVTVAFENLSDLYRALEALLRADTRHFFEIVGFKDLMIRPPQDGDRHLEILLQKNGHISTLRFELNSFLQARASLKNEIKPEIRKQTFDRALSMAHKNQVQLGTRALRHNTAVKSFLGRELAKTNLSIQRLEALQDSHTAPSSNAAFSRSTNDILCPGWQTITVDHNMSGADKLRTFLWGLNQPPCHPDRIRAGHLLYKKIYDSYDGFQFSNNPEHRSQQLLLRSVYLATADYLRARPTAAKNQMCRPEEKIRIYRGIGAMPLTRAPNAATGVHLAPLFGDQLVSGLKTLGLVNLLDQPLVPNRDLGELSYENLGRMKNLTWDYVEGVAHGWKYVLGHQRSSGYPDIDKNGIPEETAPTPPPIPFPFPFHPGPIATLA
ncbi:MAG: hypothetical protein K2X47_07870, partial [Bdellovibrionales bacterium]|nr:hypothetical protein [Bdellovibrionales bacterium]